MFGWSKSYFVNANIYRKDFEKLLIHQIEKKSNMSTFNVITNIFLNNLPDLLEFMGWYLTILLKEETGNSFNAQHVVGEIQIFGTLKKYLE